MGTHEERIEALGPAVDKLDSQGKSYALGWLAQAVTLPGFAAG